MIRCTAILALVLGAPTANAITFPLTIDFETDGVGTPLPNGFNISDNVGTTSSVFAPIFNISSTGNNSGTAVFNTNNPGPNVAANDDPDLLVNTGNAFIFQENTNNRGDKTGNIFDRPDDDRSGGFATFDFLNPVELFSIRLIDINGGSEVILTMTDTSNNQRIWTVPNLWTTNDGTESDPTSAILLLDNLVAQQGRVGGPDATFTQDAGFDISLVTTMTVDFDGSAALDDIVITNIIPAPGAAVLLGLGGLVAIRRRR